MIIDWFTVGAQIINFLILVLLLRRFLYRPILKTIEERNATIKARLDEAQQAKAEAQQLIAEYELKNRSWQEEKESLYQEAKHEIEEMRKQLLKKARLEVEHHQSLWQQALKQEKETFLSELRQRISQQTYKIARRFLQDLADIELEDHITRVFIHRLQDLDENQLEAIKSSLNDSSQPVIIRSAYEIPARTREQLEQALRSRLLDSQVVEYELSPDLMAGIELKTPGHKLSWNLRDYFESLEEDLLVGLLEFEGTNNNVEG